MDRFTLWEGFLGHPRVGKYHILKSIGKGGMGEVYLAINQGAGGIGKFVALKKIRREYTLDRKRTKLFRREAEVAIKLDHNNICAIYEVGEHDGALFLVMEYLPGVDLKQIYERRLDGSIQLEVADIINIGISVASGLAYAHDFIDPKTAKESPVIHCDLCPQNIRVSYGGAIKLIDFGVAKVIGQESHSQTDSIMGKVEYISPEHAQKKPLDGRSDIYSLGIVLWEFLVGKRYYHGDGLNAIRAHLLGDIPVKPLPSSVPLADQLQPILAKMIATDPNDRYASADELDVALRKFSNKMFPDYVPKQFREAVQFAFSDEIIEHQNLISEFSESIEEDQLQAVALPTPGVLSNPDQHRVRARAGLPGPMVPSTFQSNDGKITQTNPSKSLTSTKPTADNLFEAVQILNQSKEAKKRASSKIYPFLFILAIIVGFIYKEPKVLELIDEAKSSFASGEREPSSTTLPDDTPAKNTSPRPSKRRQKKKKAREAASAELVRIQVDSVPQGADIILNGKKAYRRTPTNLPVEAGQSYRLVLKKKGYETHREKF